MSVPAPEDLIVDIDESDGHGVFIFVLTALSLGIAIRYVCQRLSLELPYNTALLVLSVVLGLAQLGDSELAQAELVMSNMNPELLQYIFLPILMLEISLDINIRNFKRLLPVTLLLLIPGIVITALLTAVLIYYGLPRYEFDWITCLLLAAILVATDTMPIVGLMRKRGVAERLSSVIEGESAMVDCMAFILTHLFFSMLVSSNSKALADHIEGLQPPIDVGAEAQTFIQELIAAPLWGWALGIVMVFFLYRVINDALVEITTVIGCAYVAFYVGTYHLHVNGSSAVVAMGLYLNHWQRHTISPSVLPSLNVVVKTLGYVANTLIFAIAGVMCAYYTFVTGTIGGVDVGYCFLIYIFLLLTRASAAVLLLPVIRYCGYKMNWKDVLLFSWAGLRGNQSLTLSLTVILSVALDRDVIHRLGFQACGIVFLTNLINAPTAGYLIDLLRFKSDTPEARVVLNATIDQMKKDGEEQIHTMKSDKQFEAASWDKVQTLLVQLCDSAVKTYSTTHGNAKLDRMDSVIGRVQSSVMSAVDRLERRAHGRPMRSVLMSPSTRANLANGSSSDTFSENDIEHSVSQRAATVTASASVNGHANGDEVTPGAVSVNGAANTDFRQRDDLAERFLELQRTEYHRLYDTGCLTRAATVTLLKSIDASLDRKNLGEQWKVIEAALRVPRWLTYLYQQSKLRRFALVNQIVHRQVFLHFCLSVEMSAAFCKAFDKLQEFLRTHPVLREVNAEAMEEIEREAGVYATRMRATFEDIRAAFPQVYSAVHSRHAALIMLSGEQATLENLHESGLLSAVEFERLEETVQGQYVQLKRSRLENTLPAPESVLLSLYFAEHMQFMQQEWLVANARRMLVAPNTWLIEELRDREPGIFVVARGQLATYFHRSQATSDDHSRPSDSDGFVSQHHSPEVDTAGGHGLRQRLGVGFIVGARSLIDSKIDSCKTITTCELFLFPLAIVKPVLTDARFAECMMRVASDELMKSSFAHLAPFNEMTPVTISALIAHSRYFSNDTDAAMTASTVDKSTVNAGDRVLLLKGHADVEPSAAVKSASIVSVTAPAFLQIQRGPARFQASPDARWLVWRAEDEDKVLKHQNSEHPTENCHANGASASQVVTLGPSDFPWLTRSTPTVTTRRERTVGAAKPSGVELSSVKDYQDSEQSEVRASDV